MKITITPANPEYTTVTTIEPKTYYEAVDMVKYEIHEMLYDNVDESMAKPADILGTFTVTIEA